jgi:hypothetical protein
MKFNTGLLDTLFGAKTTIEIRLDDGTLRSVRVSKAWLRRMEAEGKVTMTKTPEHSVHLHIVGPDGLEHGQLVVGKDIPEDQYKKLVDPETGALYALKVYENGVPCTTIISREMWENAKRAMNSV